MKAIVNSKVVNGKCATNKGSISKAFEQFDGKEVTITIERKRRKRSNEQNAYLWCCIYPLIKQGFFETCGEVFTINEVHEIMKLKFNFIELTNESTGEVITAPKSTTKNTKFEQEQYHEQCRQFALEWFNITIPLPNEQIEIKL